MSGTVIDFTEADLKATAEAYDPKLHEAPIVVGHPKIDAPAYGWAKTLTYSDALEAEPDQVDQAFAELVNAGRFKKVSASFFMPNAPGNPKPGVYYLRHIGFLGAQAPAVKGLKNASFAEGTEGVIEFGDYGDTMQARVLRRLRDWLIGKFGNEEADKAVDPYYLEEIERAAQESNRPSPAFAEPKSTSHQETATMTPEEIKKLQDENAALKAKAKDTDDRSASFAERENKIKEQEAQAKRTGVASFVDGLVKAGKLLPRDQAPLVEFMAALDAESVIEFAESKDGATRKARGTDWLREFLGNLPKQVDYAEHSRSTVDDKTVSFAAPHGYGVDPARLDLHNKALAHQRANPNVSYEAALAAVSG